MQAQNWGILSTAAILTKGVLQGMRKCAGLKVAAVSSRDLMKAQVFATEQGIEKAYGSYEELLADPEIQVIYNPLPNHLHVEWTWAAARAGKHVLCEKPFACRADELERLRPYADKVHLREALMVRHHPQWKKAKEFVERGRLGRLQTIIGHFSYFNNHATNIRNQVETGGGALLDIGVYPIVAARYFFDAEPVGVWGRSVMHPVFGTDAHTQAVVDFGQGRQLLLSCSTQAVRHQALSLIGTESQLEFDLPFNPPAEQMSAITISTHNQARAERERIEIPAADQFHLQAEDFIRTIQSRAPDARDLEDAIAQARVLDAIRDSSHTGNWVEISS